MPLKTSAQFTIIDLTDIYIGDTPPINPRENQLWLDTSGDIDTLKKWDGDKWVEIIVSADTIDNLNTRIFNAEQSITPEAIVSTVTQSTKYIDDLTGKVNIDEVISTINQTAEQITIQADRIDLIPTSKVVIGTENLEEVLNSLGSQIEAIQGGGGNLLFNSTYGTYESPDDYWWSTGLTWYLYENRIKDWSMHQSLINSWNDFENYNW